MDYSKWVERLKDNFTTDNLIGGKLIKISDEEKKYTSYYIKNFSDYNILIDSFQSFYIETIENVYDWVKKHGWPEKNYVNVFLLYIVNFRRFRACEKLLQTGYPLDGYSLLRDLKDRAIFLCAVAKNITTFPKIYGYAQTNINTIEEMREFNNKQRKEQNRILHKIIRKQSELPDETKSNLDEWEFWFNEEVHGSKLTFYNELRKWEESRNYPTIGPTPIDSSIINYMLNSTTIAWMLTRLLPYIQPIINGFGDDWNQKYKILDDSFYQKQLGFKNIIHKDIEAKINLINEKFSFPSDFCYFEADGINNK